MRWILRKKEDQAKGSGPVDPAPAPPLEASAPYQPPQDRDLWGELSPQAGVETPSNDGLWAEEDEGPQVDSGLLDIFREETAINDFDKPVLPGLEPVDAVQLRRLAEEVASRLKRRGR